MTDSTKEAKNEEKVPIRATGAVSDSTFADRVVSVIRSIFIVPIVIFYVLTVLLIWVCTGIGYFYERVRIAADVKRYSPPPKEIITITLPITKSKGKSVQIHCIHYQHEGQDRYPPLVYISGLGASMAIVSGLLNQLHEQLAIPIEMISFDSVGYGYSTPLARSHNDTQVNEDEDNAEYELALVTEVLKAKQIRTPFLLIGGSAGASLAHLYSLRYPQQVLSMILYDPSPLTIFSQPSTSGNPFFKEFQSAESIWKSMSVMSKIGFFRTLIPLITSFSTGEMKDMFTLLPPAHLALMMKESIMRKTGIHFRYWKEIMEKIKEEEKKLEEEKKEDSSWYRIPTVMCGAIGWEAGHGGLDVATVSAWWEKEQRSMINPKHQNFEYIPFREYTHSKLMLDMKVLKEIVQKLLNGPKGNTEAKTEVREEKKMSEEETVASPEDASRL